MFKKAIEDGVKKGLEESDLRGTIHASMDKAYARGVLDSAMLLEEAIKNNRSVEDVIKIMRKHAANIESKHKKG